MKQLIRQNIIRAIIMSLLLWAVYPEVGPWTFVLLVLFSIKAILDDLLMDMRKEVQNQELEMMKALRDHIKGDGAVPIGADQPEISRKKKSNFWRKIDQKGI